MSDPAPRKSRLLHWSWLLAGTIVIFVALVGIAIVWPVYREYQAIEYLAERGYIIQLDDEPTWIVNWIREKTGFNAAFNSNLEASAFHLDVTDSDFARLAQLANLSRMEICGEGMTDSVLDALAVLQSLRELAIYDTSITDAGLVHLSKLSSLKVLCLDSDQITDAGMVHLGILTKLHELDLSDMPITDAGLRDITETCGR